MLRGFGRIKCYTIDDNTQRFFLCSVEKNQKLFTHSAHPSMKAPVSKQREREIIDEENRSILLSGMTKCLISHEKPESEHNTLEVCFPSFPR